MLDLFRHLRAHAKPAPDEGADTAHLGEVVPCPPPQARLLPGDPCDAMLPIQGGAHVPAR
jgi:hypothetical protein